MIEGCNHIKDFLEKITRYDGKNNLFNFNIKMNPKSYFTAILIFVALFLSALSVKAQSSSDTLRIEKRGTSYVYYSGNTKLNFNQAMQLMSSHPDAYTLMEKANNKRAGTQIFGTVGGLCLGGAMGYAMGAAIVGNRIKMPIFLSVAGAGAILATIGIVCEVEANKKTKEGIAVYNQSIKQKNNLRVDLARIIHREHKKLDIFYYLCGS